MAAHRAPTAASSDPMLKRLRWVAVAASVLTILIVVVSTPALAGVRRSAIQVMGLGGAGTSVLRPAASPAPTAVPERPSGPLTVVGLGDSVESGYACDCAPFVTLAAQALADTQQREVTVQNEAVPGAASADVLEQLDEPGVRARIASSELVVIEIGANDFDEATAYNGLCLTPTESGCYGTTLAQVRANLTRIVTQVKALQTTPGAQVVVMGYWNVFDDGDVARAQGATYVGVSRALTAAFNAVVAEVAQEEGVRTADARTPFVGADDARDPTAFLTADGDYPNAVGHHLLADAVISALGTTVATL